MGGATISQRGHRIAIMTCPRIGGITLRTLKKDGLRKLGFLTRHHHQSGPYHEGSFSAWAVQPTDEHLVTKVCTRLAYVAASRAHGP